MKSKFLHIGKGSLSVILSVMMIMSTMILGVGNVSTIDASAETTQLDDAVSDGYYRVYFYDKYGWGDLKAYYWGTDYKPITWDQSEPMTKSKDYESLYYFDLSDQEGTADSIIFHSGSKKSKDITDLLDHKGEVWVPSEDNNGDAGNSGSWMTLEDYYNVYVAYDTVDPMDGYYRVYFANDKDWSSVKAYIWGPKVELAKWPGTLMEESHVYDGFYYIDVDSSIGYEQIIFNGSGGQTDDLNLSEDYNNWIWSYSKGDWLSLEDYLKIDYYIVGRFRAKDSDGNYIWNSGTVNGWDLNSTTLKFSKVEGEDTLYKFETNCTEEELSYRVTDTTPQYFKLKSSEGMYIQPSTEITVGNGTTYPEKTIVKLAPSSSNGSSVHFNSTLTNGTVVLYFDSSSNEFWYELDGLELFDNNITFGSNGSAVIDMTTASAGKTITVTVSPDQGYTVDTITATGADGSSIDLKQTNANTYTYTMPKQSVNVNVTFRTAKTFTVKAQVAAGCESFGSVSVSKDSVTEGETVTLTATPKSGYSVKWTIGGEYAEAGSVDLTANSLTISPKENIIASVSFKETPGTLDSSKFLFYATTDSGLIQSTSYLPIYKKQDGSYYADFSSDMLKTSSTYYFNVASSSAGKGDGYYHQEDEGNLINISTDYSDYVSVGKQNRNENNTTYNFFWFSIKSGQKDSVMSVRLNITADANGNIYPGGYSITPEIDPEAPLKVKVIAKDGTIRSSFEKFPQMADTTVKYSDGTPLETSREYSDKATVARVKKGSEITVTTKVNDSYKSQYYVRAFCINGLSYEVINKEEALSKNGVYTCTYTIPEDAEDTVEITPIYFYFDDTNAITFYVEHFEGDVKSVWGNTISCHVYYEGGSEQAAYDSSSKNAFGGYPGQPMVYDGGRYYVQIPKYLNGDASKPVKGITLNNYKWDEVHGSLIGNKENCQTYDYDDFSFLTEKTNNIVFRFKYRTKNNNQSGNALSGNIPNVSGLGSLENYKNGWETLKNYVDEDVDVFGHVLSDEQKDGEKVYIVSNGYEVNYLGDYATEWYIYDQDGNFVANLPPSALLYEVKPEDLIDGKLSEDKMPDGFQGSLGSSSKNRFRSSFWSAYVKLYNAGFTGRPAEITYETSILSNGDLNGGAASNMGNRCDGRWFYIEDNKPIRAQILIEYSDGKDSEYITDTFVDDGNVGEVTGAKTYFTNPKEYYGKTETGEVQSKIGDYFKFVTEGAAAGTDYYFVGWYLLQDGEYTPLNSTSGSHNPDMDGQTEMITNVTLVARYKKYSEDDLRISHDIYTNAVKYEDSPEAHGGNGTPYLTVEVVDSNGNVVEKISNISNSNVAISKSKLEYYRDEGDYKLVVKLKTTPDEGDTLNTVYRQDDKSYIEHNDDKEWSVSGTTDDNNIVYTYPISDLFDGDSLKTNHIPFYSDLLSGKISVDFKYFDRAYVQGKPATISETPTVITVDQVTVISDSKPDIDATVANAMSDNKMKNVDTVIDSYVFWASQEEAVTGVQQQINYHDSATDGNTVTYKKYSMTPYHMDCYGNVQGSAGCIVNDGEKWVTYYSASGKELTSDEINSDPYLVSKITVWGYNTPKTYTVTLQCPGEDTTSMIADSNGVYFDTNAVPNSVQSFYNVRVGGTGYDNEEDANALNDYLKKRGIEIPYVGEKVTPPKTVTEEGNVFKFDGWYDENGVKVSSDNSYANRITSDINLRAGYVPEGSSSDIGVSVTKNTTDRYIDENGVERVRFNTQLNVYGCNDSDENIKDVAAIYIQLPTDVEWNENNLSKIDFNSIRAEIQKTLTENNSHKGTCVVDIGGVETDHSGNVIYYTYDVVWNKNPDYFESYEVTLSNKNRVQFTLTMKAELCGEGGSNSAILAFAAINYDGIGWIVSDNYVPYIKGE